MALYTAGNVPQIMHLNPGDRMVLDNGKYMYWNGFVWNPSKPLDYEKPEERKQILNNRVGFSYKDVPYYGD